MATRLFGALNWPLVKGPGEFMWWNQLALSKMTRI